MSTPKYRHRHIDIIFENVDIDISTCRRPKKGRHVDFSTCRCRAALLPGDYFSELNIIFLVLIKKIWILEKLLDNIRKLTKSSNK